MTLITHPYSLLFTTFRPSDHSTQQKPHQKWRGSEKESGGEREKGEKKGGTGRKRGVERFREVHIDTNP